MMCQKSPVINTLPSLHKVQINQNNIITTNRKSEFGFKIAILIGLAVHNSFLTVLVRNSRIRKVNEMYLPTVAVLWTEVLKFIISLLLVAREEGGFKRLSKAISTHVYGQFKDTLKLCVPAVIYTVQNNLFFVGASHLDAATFKVTSQLKIFTTALFTVIVLKQSLSKNQMQVVYTLYFLINSRLALAILFVGVYLVQLQPESAKSTSPTEKPLIGVTAVVVACFLSGFAGIYFEKILKSASKVTIWMRNIQLGIFAIPSSLFAVLIQDGVFVKENGVFYGFDKMVWFTVIWWSIGGLAVAVCIKHAGNIAKNFAASVAIILATALSIYIFGFQLSFPFCVGALLVIFSIYLYSPL